MQIVDANVLVYAVDDRSPLHERALAWLDDALAGTETIGLPWIVLLAFLRLTTNAALFPEPLSVENATDVVDVWLSSPVAVIVEPTPRHVGLLRAFVRETGAAGNLVNDAHLAALALEHDAVIVSFDRDFQRFDGVRWSMPAAG